MKLVRSLLVLVALTNAFTILKAQTTQRQRPAEWESLIFGGRFMDRFLPMTNNNQPARSDTWGAKNVVPRYIENGIETPSWSMWCANIVYEANQYHMFVNGWRESSPKGHAAWPGSIVFHATSDNMTGPFTIRDTIGKGHNAEGFQLKDGRWIIYVIDGYYFAENINGPWTYNKFNFQSRDRRIMDGMSNCTFAQREDGSYLMVNRGGRHVVQQNG